MKQKSVLDMNVCVYLVMEAITIHHHSSEWTKNET